MEKPLKLLKTFTLDLSRVLCFSSNNLETFGLQHSSLEHNDAPNATTSCVENPSNDWNHDAKNDCVDMPHGEHLVLPPTLTNDDFIRWYEDYCKKIDQVLARDNLHILNARQCRQLVIKLKHAVNWILEEIPSFGGVESKNILKDVHRLVVKAFSLVEECGGQNLCVSVVFQLENEESFRELLLELECCFEATCVKIQSKDKINSVDFGMASMKDVQYDRQNFKSILESSKIASMSNKSSKLAKYLLKRLDNLNQVKGGELNNLEFADCGTFEKGKQLGKDGGVGSVYKSKWMGLTCATKVLTNSEGPCDEKTMENFRKESSVVAGLNHPNLIKFMGMGKGDDGWPFLMMEKMDTSLKNLISEQISKGLHLLPYDVLLDIIQQIASAMYYLHDMHVAHRDLKPDNILWTPLRDKEESLTSSSSFGCIKLIDFGISKIEVGSGSFDPDSMGTSVYRAPEVLKAYAKGNANYFQADVYSFGITCAELLSGRLSFEQEQPTFFSRDLYEMIKAGVRPDLPSFCGELSILIRDCCAFNPLERPTFSEIWKQLRTMKINQLVGQGIMQTRMKKCNHKVYEAEQDGMHTELFGVVEKIKEVQNHLQKVNTLGIVGMGGLGKSTIAKALLHAEEGNAKFHKRCFHYIGKLRSDERCLPILQDILKKLGVDKDVKNLSDGQIELKKALKNNNILLILDDVWDSSHFNKIVSQDIFSSYSNSTLVVCSRNSNVIKDHVAKIYYLQPLVDGDLAMKLFTTHCFGDGKVNMPKQFLEVGSEIVKACEGLPLSLKVLGAFLHGKERVRSWERVLQRLKRGRSPQTGNIGDDGRIFEVFRISFDELEEVEKTMFLDICCFFLEDVYGRKLHVHPDCTYLLTYGESSLVKAFETLQHHSLVDVHDGMLLMHDHLRDMGREIVELKVNAQLSSVDKEKKYAGTRLVYPSTNTFEQMMREAFDFKNLEGILYQVSRNDATMNKYLNENQYPRLRIFLLRTKEEEIFYNFKNLTHVTLLDLHGFHLRELPNGVENLKSLKSLNLSWSFQLSTLPDALGNLPSLIYLNLSRCSKLSTLPDALGNLSSLTSLDVSGCSNLSTLPVALGNLSSLTSLDLRKCSKLLTLPDALGNLSSLTSLDLSECHELSSLPDALENLLSLTYLNLSRCSKLSRLPDALGNLSSLKSLELNLCFKLSRLPDALKNLSSLTSLELNLCFKLLRLPDALGNLSSLTSLELCACSKLSRLPDVLGNLSSLTSLNLNRCYKLSRLPNALGNLSSLTSLSLSRCYKLSRLPNALGNLSSLRTLFLNKCLKLSTLPDALGNLSSLTTLYMSKCSKLSTLPDALGNLSSLTSLDVSGCSKLLTLPDALENLSSLTSLDLSGCSKLLTLPDALENLSSLTSLDVSGCSKLSTLPNALGNLSSLTSLNLSGCSKLSILPNALGNLFSLTSLNLSGCSKLSILPNALGNLSFLTSLNLSWCFELFTLPDTLGNLSSLTSLDLSGCSKLSTLPDTLVNLSSLTSLNLSGCSKLSTLPNALGNLSSLTSLNLSWCFELFTLPDTLVNLSSLTSLNLSGCSKLSTLPNALGNLSSLTSLNLSGCSKLSILPNALGNLSSLTSLNLSKCSMLPTLPNTLVNLSSLTSLNLSRCSKLLTLPADLGNLSSLTSLNLSGCYKLSTLPADLGNLSSLTSLDLSGCYKLSSLPDALENLPSLTYLNLRRCSELLPLSYALTNLSSLTW